SIQLVFLNQFKKCQQIKKTKCKKDKAQKELIFYKKTVNIKIMKIKYYICQKNYHLFRLYQEISKKKTKKKMNLQKNKSLFILKASFFSLYNKQKQLIQLLQSNKILNKTQFRENKLIKQFQDLLHSKKNQNQDLLSLISIQSSFHRNWEKKTNKKYFLLNNQDKIV
ncbi:hypothetical protein IMG5_115910, partial [Ichthyophthirius multifiliis]